MTKTETAILKMVDEGRGGEAGIDFGITIGGRKYGTRLINAANKLTRAGVLERSRPSDIYRDAKRGKTGVYYTVYVRRATK